MYKLNKGISIWFTGLPSSGKTTIAKELTSLFDEHSIPVIPLDGDRVRPIIGRDLDFSEEGRFQSLLRYTQLTNLLLDSKVVSVVSVINHSQKQRDYTRENHPDGQFVEVWINTTVEECIKRDVKGLYKKALAGELENMVGVSITYEEPQKPDIMIDTSQESPLVAAKKIFDFFTEKQLIVKREIS